MLTYRNTKDTIPNWEPLHVKQPRGYAFETDTHFVHYFGADDYFWTISTGLTATQGKVGNLDAWIERTFGASEVKLSLHQPGHSISGVWRPGLFYDSEVLQALGRTEHERRLSEQALLLLLERLNEILNFIEPASSSLSAYGHRIRDLLILACTEVEHSFRSYLRQAHYGAADQRFGTSDYVKLNPALWLSDYEVTFPRYPAVPPVRPFWGWTDKPGPTVTLPWYDAYNKAKHDRASNFADANLGNCLTAVAAN